MNTESPSPTHRFAWDGFSFEVPADWNLSGYKLERRMGSVQMQDDVGVRLEMEWLREAGAVRPGRVSRMQEHASRSMAEAGATSQVLDPMPPGWHAALYSLNMS